MGASACPYENELDGDSVMSNFDRTIDEKIAARLKVEEAFSRYPGWNFNGRVWWDRAGEKWKCEPWTYGIPNEVVEADDLDGIMTQVSEEYGFE